MCILRKKAIFIIDVRGGESPVTSIPDMHGQFLFRDESLAALRADVLPALIALVGLLAEVETTPAVQINFKLALPSLANTNVLSQLNQRKF